VWHYRSGKPKLNSRSCWCRCAKQFECGYWFLSCLVNACELPSIRQGSRQVWQISLQAPAQWLWFRKASLRVFSQGSSIWRLFSQSPVCFTPVIHFRPIQSGDADATAFTSKNEPSSVPCSSPGVAATRILPMHVMATLHPPILAMDRQSGSSLTEERIFKPRIQKTKHQFFWLLSMAIIIPSICLLREAWISTWKMNRGRRC
jgi:hypothetical protein